MRGLQSIVRVSCPGDVRLSRRMRGDQLLARLPPRPADASQLAHVKSLDAISSVGWLSDLPGPEQSGHTYPAIHADV